MQVVLVEDDAPLARVLGRGLRAHGFEVVSPAPGDDLAARACDAEVGILVLDVPFAHGDARLLLEHVARVRPRLPILLLTLHNGVADMARALHANEADFLSKPFALEELIARIRARTRGANEARKTMLSAGELRLDLLARCAWLGDQIIDLSSRELALLEYFMRHPNRVLARQTILTDVWRYDADPTSNVVDVYVRYLRNKLGERAGSYIVTERRAGYRFEPNAVPSSGPEVSVRAVEGSSG